MSEHLGAISTIRELTVIESALLFFHVENWSGPENINQFGKMLELEGWKWHTWKLKNVRLGGAIATTYWALVNVDRETAKHLTPPEEDTDSKPAFGLGGQRYSATWST